MRKNNSTEEEKLENTRRLFANSKGIDQTQKRWYYDSVLDPEAKVIISDKGELFIRDKQMWQDFVSNTWISGQEEPEGIIVEED